MSKVFRFYCLLFVVFCSFPVYGQGLCKEIIGLQDEALLYKVKDKEGRYFVVNLDPMNPFNDFTARFGLRLNPYEDELYVSTKYRIISKNEIELYHIDKYGREKKMLCCKFLKNEDMIKVTVYMTYDDMIVFLPKGDNETLDLLATLEDGLCR